MRTWTRSLVGALAATAALAPMHGVGAAPPDAAAEVEPAGPPPPTDDPGLDAEEALSERIEIARTFARFEEAAALMELHAARYPGSASAATHLREALAIRLALRQEKEARADVAAAEALFADTYPDLAAPYFWALAELTTTDAARQAHAEAYLRRHGATGGVDRRIVAEATIAAIAWRRACPGGEVNGLCVAPPPQPRSKSKPKSKIRRCAEPTTPLPRPRTRRLAEAAQARLAAIGALARRSKIQIPDDDRRRLADFHDAVAQSRLAALDRDLEVFLAMAMPTGLRFAVDPRAPEDVQQKQRMVREASMRRLHEYLAQKEALGRELMRGYDELRAEKRSLPAMLAAPQRVGLIFESFADQLRSAEIPREIAGEAAERAYCKVLHDQAEPILEQARVVYTYCADRAVVFQYVNEASRACDDALARLTRSAWPPLLEFVGEPAPCGEAPPRSVGVQFDPPEIVADEAADG